MEDDLVQPGLVATERICRSSIKMYMQLYRLHKRHMQLDRPHIAYIHTSLNLFYHVACMHLLNQEIDTCHLWDQAIDTSHGMFFNEEKLKVVCDEHLSMPFFY